MRPRSGEGPRRLRPGPGQARELTRLLRRNADFRRLFLASVVSLGGDWFAFVAVSGLVIDLTGRESSTGLVFAANVLPVFLLSPLAGVVADRVDRRRMMVTADLLRVPAALGLLAAAVLEEAWIAYLSMSLISALAAFFEPVTSAVLPNLVDDEDLGLAQTALSSVWGSMLFVGAAVGGVFTAAFGREASFVVDAATFAASAWLVVRIRRPFRSGEVAAKATVLTHLGEVWALARGRKVTRAFMVTKAGVGVGNGIVGLLPLYAKLRYGLSDAGIGVLFAARGLGALLGPFAARALVRGDGRRQVAACGVAILAYAAAYAFLPFAGGLAVAAVLVMLAHAGGGAQWVLSTLGLQVTTPDAIRGRVMSLDFGLATLAVGISALLAAGAAELFGLTATSLGLVGVSLVYGVVWLAWTRDLWAGDADPVAAWAHAPVAVDRPLLTEHAE